MTEQQYGLRFDIYERVYLTNEVEGIRELDQIELVPHIQVLSQGEQALLKGNLLLSGTYVGEGEQEVRTLEHLIPVEITLPMNRIHRVEDIMVEIENFDVDLLSARSLNVTGVLSLHGVEMITESNRVWSEEEVVFVHPAEERSEPTPVQAAEPIQAVPQVIQVPMPILPSNADPINDENVIPSVEEMNAELKVAFGSKKAGKSAEEKAYGIKSLLQKANALFQSDKRTASEVQAEADRSKAAESRLDALEWKKLFLSAEANEQQFRKVRMCIVQKEDTLEVIAKKYQLNPRELQLLNRLNDQDVSAGQIIYLPR